MTSWLSDFVLNTATPVCEAAVYALTARLTTPSDVEQQDAEFSTTSLTLKGVEKSSGQTAINVFTTIRSCTDVLVAVEDNAQYWRTEKKEKRHFEQRDSEIRLTRESLEEK